MSRIFIMIAFILAIGCVQALAQTDATSTACYNDKLSNTNGSSIRTGSGLIFQAYPGSNATLSFWAPLDQIKICRLGGTAVQITNLSKNDQQVKALRKN
jgi:hypothetical protein